eukprot:6043049-Pyramimonas_sp.AAC.1
MIVISSSLECVPLPVAGMGRATASDLPPGMIQNPDPGMIQNPDPGMILNHSSILFLVLPRRSSSN